MIGIPYARRVEIDGAWYSICPRCEAKIELRERKDFESHSGREYAEHFAAEHAGDEKPQSA